MQALYSLCTIVLFFSLFLTCGTAQKQDDGFLPLFDGKTLNGWHADGGELERWEVRDGVIICDGGSSDGKST